MDTYIFIAAYLLSVALTYAGTFAYFQKQFPTISHRDLRGQRNFALLIALFGPFSLIVSFIGTRFFRDGLKWR